MRVAYYHNHCYDGLGAAWAVEQAFDKTEANYILAPIEYNRPIKGYNKGFDVYFVDFCPTLENIQAMIKAEVKSITIIDHHKSAFAVREACERLGLTTEFDLKFVLELNMSGATLTYRTLVDSVGEIPQVLRHIEDRDLWRHKLEDTGPVIAAVARCEGIVQFGELMQRPFEDVLDEGRILYASYMSSVERAKSTYDINGVPMVLFDRKRVGMIHVPYSVSSEVADRILVEHCNIDAIVNCIPNIMRRDVKLSIRSRNGQAIEIAEALGGGGHPNASGTEITFTHFYNVFDDKFEFVKNPFTSIYEYKDELEVDVINVKEKGPVILRRELVHTEEGLADMLCVYSDDGRWLSNNEAVFWKLAEMDIEEFFSTECPRMAVYGKLNTGEYFCWKDNDVRVFTLGSEVTRTDVDYYLPHDLSDARYHMELLASATLDGMECKAQLSEYVNAEGVKQVGFRIHTEEGTELMVMDMYRKFGSPNRVVNKLEDGQRLALESLECFRPVFVELEPVEQEADA